MPENVISDAEWGQFIRQFADKYRLRWKLNPDDGTTIIPGKNGDSDIYEYGLDRLAFMLAPVKKTNQWPFLIKHLVAPQFEITQRGDFEGCAIFDHTKPEIVKLVMKVCRISRRRKLSEEHRERSVATLLKFRFDPRLNEGKRRESRG